MLRNRKETGSPTSTMAEANVVVEETPAVDSDEKEEVDETASHLVVLVHGLFGSIADWTNFKRHLEESEHGRDLVVLAISKNSSTIDGIEAGAKRAYGEVKEYLAKFRNSLRRISVVGHSLGGLYARYLVYLMDQDRLFEKLEPCAFVTLATPHLGSRRVENNPIGCIWNRIILRVFQTTRELGLLDGDANTEPLLTRMTHHEFLEPLKKFKKRALYSNVGNDTSVSYTTACIRYKNPYKAGNVPTIQDDMSRSGGKCIPNKRQSAHRGLSKDFANFTSWSLENVHNRKHWSTAQHLEHGVISLMPQENNEEPEQVENDQLIVNEMSASKAFKRDKEKDRLRAMMVALDVKVGHWERYDVSFASFFAHEQIINKRAYLPGKSVVRHFHANVLQPVHKGV